MCYWKTLPHSSIGVLYNIIQHVVVLDLDFDLILLKYDVWFEQHGISCLRFGSNTTSNTCFGMTSLSAWILM